MKNHTSSFLRKSVKALALISFVALWPVNVSAESIYEDFEEVTIVDDEGNDVSGWTSGTGLSNGWHILNGTFYANDNGDYGLIHAIGKGFAMSDYYLTAASSSVNNAYVFIPERLSGEVMVWARSNLDERSKKTSTLKVYEATSDGDVDTSTLLYSATPVKGSSEWKPFKFTIESSEGKYIAINLIYTDIDDFSATIADGSAETAVLTVSTEAIDFGTISAESSQSFTVKSSITTSVSFAVVGPDRDAFQLAGVPATLTAGVEKTVEVKMNATEPGDYKATLMITAGELTKRITLTGIWEEKGDTPDDPNPDNTADWMGEDFAGLEAIPDTWTVGEGADWTIDDWWLDSAPALKGFSGFICTPMFTVGENQGLEFYFQKGMSYSWGSKCVVSYSTDKKEWITAESYDQYSDNGTKTIAFPAPGNYYLGLDLNAISYFDDFKVVNLISTGINEIGNSPSHDLQFDLQGRRIASSVLNHQPSIIIVGGKKMLKK